MKDVISLSRGLGWRALALALSLTPSTFAFAVTDIDNAPIVTTTAAQAKPNVMLLMDASDSMARTHMPDEVESVTRSTSVGYKNSKCNVIYYDPNKKYDIPKDENGVDFAVPTFTNAPYTGFASKLISPTALQASSTDLSQWFLAYDNTTLEIPRPYVDGGSIPVPAPYVAASGHYPGVPAYYYVYTPPGSGPADVLGYASAACAITDPGTSYATPVATPAGGTWTRVIVSSTSGSGTVGPDERTNFAIWYSFYRTRLSLTKSAASLAFTPLGNTYRVGFLTVEPKASPAIRDVDPLRYLPMADFDSTNRVTWFKKLFSQTTGGASPAREGLARVGRYYGGRSDKINSKMNTGLLVNGILDADPVQYACQQNFTIMTTDGYWNAHTETTGIGGPQKLDGTNWVAQQDGQSTCTFTDPACMRPIYDGVSSGREVDTTNESIYVSTVCSAGGYQQTTKHSTSTVNRYTKNSTATQQQTVSYMLSSQQTMAQTSQTSRYDTQITQTKKRLFTEDRTVTQTSYVVEEKVEHTQITTQQYLRSAAQIVARSFQTHELVQNYQQTVNQWQQSSKQYVETKSQWQEGTSQFKYGAVQWLRATYQVNLLDASGETFSVPTAERCIIGGQPLKGTTPSSLACAVVVSYGGGGLPSDPNGDGNSTALRYDNSSTCASLVAGGTGTWTAGVYSVIDPTSPYLHTDCKPGSATAAYGPVASCPLATQAPSIANSWTTATCDQITVAAAPVTACTYGPGATTGPGQVVYTCTQTVNTSGPVAACTYPTSPFVDPSLTTFTCTQPAATNFAMGPSPACAPADGLPHTDASFITTVCGKAIDNQITTVPSCTANLGTSSANGYKAIACSPQNTASDTIVADATCLADSTANAGLTADGTGTITCTQVAAGPDAAGNVPEPSCPPASGGFEYACTNGPLNQPVATPVPAASCPAGVGVQPGSGVAPDYVTYTCSAPGATNIPAVPPTYIDPASCTSGTSGTQVTTTCTNVPVSGPTVVDPALCNGGTLGTIVGSTPAYLVTTCTRRAVGIPVGLPACPMFDPPTSTNGWVTTECATNYANTTPVPWGSCVVGAVVPIGPGVDRICELEGPTDTFVTSCSPTAVNGDDGTAAHWNVACSGAAVVASPPVAPSLIGIVGAHNVDSATCVDGSVWGANIVAHCSTTSVGTPYPVATPVASCTAGFDATGAYGPAGLTWDCQPGAGTTPAHAVAASDPACVLDSNGNPQTGPGQITTTCTRTDDGGLVAGLPNYVSAASCAAAIVSSPLSTITCTAVPLTNVPADPATCLVGSTSASYPYDLITWCSGPISTAGPGGPCTSAPTPTAPNFETTTCGFTAPVTTSVPTCTPTYSSPGVPGPDPATGDLTTCTPDAAGVQYAIKTTTTVTTIDTVNGVVAAPVVVPTSVTTPGDGVCYASAASFPPLVQPSCPLSAPCKVVTTAPGGSLNSLADVAQYYYQTDLRPAGNPSGSPNNIVSDGSVRPVGAGVEADTANHVHMTTFVVGLGVSGTLNYDPNYKAGAGDFGAIRTGAKVWPVWPDPTAGPQAANGNYVNQDDWNNPKSIDDYWHTAVDGRGMYFSATDPSSVVLGLGTALSAVQAVNGAGAADAVSSLQPTTGNNFAYSTGYVTSLWAGDLRAFEINLATGAVDPIEKWSATNLLNSLVSNACDNRNIYLLDKANAAAVNGLVNFTLSTSKCDAGGSPLSAVPDGLTTVAELAAVSVTPNIASLSQYFNMTATQKAAATSPALVNYLRGQRGDEIVATSTTKLFRARTGVLGDIVDSQPVYVQKPFANYLDSGYGAFQTTWANRAPMVYVGGNDGMLHAFNAVVNPPLPSPPIDAQAGMEKWAVIPSTVLPNMYRLADSAYVAPANHRFFVDGTPVAADIDVDGSGNWKTILVGGLNAGGKGYYAIDVTDPSVLPPKALWEFKQDSTQCPSAALGPYSASVAVQSSYTGDCHLGLTFGKPVVTKLAGRWVVMFASGYNNDDGVGYLYVVDAYTGRLIQKIETPAVSGADAGLAQINNYVNNALSDNTTVRAYGGDLLGRIWRFDFAGAGSAQLIGTAQDGVSTAQPITTRIELAELNGKPMVFVGTGQLLGALDIANVNQQSVYGIVDPLTSVGGPIYSPLRSSLNQLKMTQIGSGAGAKRTVACASVGTCVNSGGWVVDFPDAISTPTEKGERVNVEMKLILGTLVVASNVPTNDVCTVGGHSWYNYLNFSDGQAVNGADLSIAGNPNSARIVSEYLSDSIIVGFNVIQLPPPAGSANPRFITQIRTSDGLEHAKKLPVSPPPFQGKRISWREIVQP